MFVINATGRGPADQNVRGAVADGAARTNQGLRLNRSFECDTWLAPPESVR